MRNSVEHMKPIINWDSYGHESYARTGEAMTNLVEKLLTENINNLNFYFATNCAWDSYGMTKLVGKPQTETYNYLRFLRNDKLGWKTAN